MSATPMSFLRAPKAMTLASLWSSSSVTWVIRSTFSQMMYAGMRNAIIAPPTKPRRMPRCVVICRSAWRGYRCANPRTARIIFWCPSESINSPARPACLSTDHARPRQHATFVRSADRVRQYRVFGGASLGGRGVFRYRLVPGAAAVADGADRARASPTHR